jgi:hypothetical protein
MLRNLFGEEHLEPIDAAKIAKDFLDEAPFYRMDFEERDNGISLKCYHGDFKVALSDPGIYAIYNHDGCLYVGLTHYKVYQRGYRFGKDLAGKSRLDENHAGGRRAREDGLTLDEVFYLKTISLDDVMDKVDKMDPEYKHVYGHFPIDEWIAGLLESKYNTRKVHM